MFLTGLGIYFSIGLIIFAILYISGFVEKSMPSYIGFYSNLDIITIYLLLILFVMILWLPIVFWGIIDLLVGIYYFGEEK